MSKGIEQFGLGLMRWQFAGTKYFAAADPVEIEKILSAAGMPSELCDCLRYLENITPENVPCVTALPSLVVGISEPGDIVYLAPSSIVVDKTVNCHASGMRITIPIVPRRKSYLKIVEGCAPHFVMTQISKVLSYFEDEEEDIEDQLVERVQGIDDQV